MKFFPIVIVCALFGSLILGCAKSATKGVMGNWSVNPHSVPGAAGTLVVSFHDDNTFDLSYTDIPIDGTYAVSGNDLTLTVQTISNKSVNGFAMQMAPLHATLSADGKNLTMDVPGSSDKQIMTKDKPLYGAN